MNVISCAILFLRPCSISKFKVFIDWFNLHLLLFSFIERGIYKLFNVNFDFFLCLWKHHFDSYCCQMQQKREKLIGFFSSTDCCQLCNFCRAVCSDSCRLWLANVGEQEQLERSYLGEHQGNIYWYWAREETYWLIPLFFFHIYHRKYF